MDKSSRIQKNIIRANFWGGIFKYTLLLCLWVVPFTHSGILRAGTDTPNSLSNKDRGNFRITTENLNLLNFKSLLEKHSAGIKYEGEVSLSSDVKVEEGRGIISSGTFSSQKLSLSSENFLFPLEFSQLEGEFTIDFKGGSPNITGKIKSAYFEWGRLSAQELKANYRLQGKNLFIENGEMKTAKGVVYINGNIDFAKSPTFFNIKLDVQGVDIGIISEQWGYTHSVSGILFCDAGLSGEFGKPTSILGKAKIDIDEGELGKVGLIGRILTFSPFAAVSRDFSLTTFHADFKVFEGYAYTDNAEIKGPGIRITSTGEVGWNKKLNFILGLYASSELLGGTSLTKALGGIIDEFGNVLRRIKLTGTIDNPSFTILPLGIGGVIVEGLQRSFKTEQKREDSR